MKPFILATLVFFTAMPPSVQAQQLRPSDLVQLFQVRNQPDSVVRFVQTKGYQFIETGYDSVDYKSIYFNLKGRQLIFHSKADEILSIEYRVRDSLEAASWDPLLKGIGFSIRTVQKSNDRESRSYSRGDVMVLYASDADDGKKAYGITAMADPAKKKQ